MLLGGFDTSRSSTLSRHSSFAGILKYSDRGDQVFSVPLLAGCQPAISLLILQHKLQRVLAADNLGGQQQCHSIGQKEEWKEWWKMFLCFIELLLKN
jgi:hypothetical protein